MNKKTDSRTAWARELLNVGDKLATVGAQLDRVKIPLTPDQVRFLQNETNEGRFNLLVLIGAPCAVIDRFALWAEVNEPHLATAARKRVESLIRQESHVGAFLYDPDHKRRFLAGEAAAVQAGFDWLTFTADIQDAGLFLKECAALLGTGQHPKDADAPRMSAAELEALRGKAASNPLEAAEQLVAAFPDLTTRELHAGMMHLKGATWDAMQRECKCARGTLSNAITRFYRVTDFARPDRKGGFKGRMYSFNENMDSESRIGKAKRTRRTE